MSFKVKRWGDWHQINPQDFDPTCNTHPSTTDGTPYAFPWDGRIIFLAYDSTSTPCWYLYDPPTLDWSGPFYPPEGSLVGGNWGGYSVSYGYYREYKTWGNQWLLGYGTNQSGYHAVGFFGWDAQMNFVEWKPPAFPAGSYSHVENWTDSIGVDSAGLPCRTIAQYWNGPLAMRLVTIGPGGTITEFEGLPTDLFWSTNQGVTLRTASRRGTLWQWGVGEACAYPNNGSNLYAAPVEVGNQCNPMLALTCDVRFATVGEGGVYGLVGDKDPNSPTYYTAELTNPGTPASPPWVSTWDFRRRRDGAEYAIDSNGDLDGIEQGLGTDYPIKSDVTYCSDGHYVGLTHTSVASDARYLRLNPWPPAGMNPRPAKLGTAAIGWIGECAIRPNLRVENVLPAGRANPQGLGGSVVERKSGKYLITPGAIVKRSGDALTVGPPLSVDVSSYPVTSEDWEWPGSEDGRVEMMGWSCFAEGPDDTMLWGGMPDYMWGMYLLVEGYGFVPRWSGLGVVHNENLEAAAGMPTHKLENSGTVISTMGAMPPLPANYESAPAQLIGWPDFPGGPVVAYFGSATQQSSPPYWRAIVWRVLNGVWTAIVDFNALGSPGLGETSWTVWSVAPIRACRALPQGGFLVGATLYFAPWDAWETTPGTRDATFLNTGLGYVPGKPGYEGPVPVENVPQYLVCEPLSGGRSLYGPDALLVYDHAGNFITHLNTPDVYPPDGRQILVTRETVPRVIYKTYWQGTYSDYAEGWGVYHRFDEDADTQTGIYVCYDLMSAVGKIVPGMGRCHGFLDMYALGAGQTPAWRWGMPSTYMGEGLTHPQGWWGGTGRSQMRVGLGGRSITLLGSRGPSSRQGTKGVGQRS